MGLKYVSVLLSGYTAIADFKTSLETEIFAYFKLLEFVRSAEKEVIRTGHQSTERKNTSHHLRLHHKITNTKTPQSLLQESIKYFSCKCIEMDESSVTEANHFFVPLLRALAHTTCLNDAARGGRG